MKRYSNHKFFFIHWNEIKPIKSYIFMYCSWIEKEIIFSNLLHMNIFYIYQICTSKKKICFYYPYTVSTYPAKIRKVFPGKLFGKSLKIIFFRLRILLTFFAMWDKYLIQILINLYGNLFRFYYFYLDKILKAFHFI